MEHSEALSELEKLCKEHNKPFGDVLVLYMQTKEVMKDMRSFMPSYDPYTFYEDAVQSAAFLNTKYYVTHGEGWSLPIDYNKPGESEKFWNAYRIEERK